MRHLETACIASAALLLIGLPLRGAALPETTPLALFVVLLVLAENAAVLMPTNARVSPSFMVVMASIAAFGSHGGVLGAAIVGGCGGLILDHLRRRKFRIVLFNCAQYVLAGAASAFLYEFLQRVGAPVGVPVVVAAVVFGVINVGLVLPGAASDAGTTMQAVWADLAPAMPNYLIFGLLGSLIGALYTRFGPGSVLVLVSPLVVVRTVLLAFMRLRQALRRMEALYGFTRRLGGDLDVDSVVNNTLVEVRRMFGAEWVELLLVAGTNGPVARTVAGEDGAVPVACPDQPRALEVRVLEEGQPAFESARERMVVPVYGESGAAIGALTAGDKEDSGRYSADDIKLLETLANHASVAFANGRLVERLRHDSLHDALTGLGNRALFQEAMDAVAPSGDSLAAVMLLDLDRFKEVNDTLGHESGDLLLQQIGLRLRDLIGSRGTVSRLGGDEFAILLPLEHIGEAGEVAHQVLTALEQPFTVGDLRLEIGASIGVAMAPVDGDTAATLMQRADVAMYAAKENRTGWELYSREHDRYSPRRLVLAADLRHALERDELMLYYQPKAELGSGTVTGVEALLRWRHPEYGFVPPDEFIPIAEHTGLIRPLTSWVLQEAVRQAAAWVTMGYDLSVAVNLSVRSLMDGALPEEVAGALRGADLAATSLILEITESTIMADPNRAIAILTRLADQGISLAIDDFGTGYSSLAYLKRLPVSEVKVDRSFVMNMANDQDDVVIVRSTVDLARNLGLRVVAEGVEDAEAWDHLRVLGCDAVQGYYLARPMPAADLTRWLAAYATKASISG
ncbi:MAG TPA: EAL domain-containing protein [Acidimicrobiales bacterium]|nr:EAL domain-containing protein [Acidimicrobiales bacterium]